MIDINLIRQDPEAVKQALLKRRRSRLPSCSMWSAER